MKITNLEKFTLEQIFRPYQSMLFGGADVKRMSGLSKDYNLDTVLDLFNGNPEWRDVVMNRIVRCEFIFPDYIQHPLVSFIKNWKYDNR